MTCEILEKWFTEMRPIKIMFRRRDIIVTKKIGKSRIFFNIGSCYRFKHVWGGSGGRG